MKKKKQKKRKKRKLTQNGRSVNCEYSDRFVIYY